MNELSPVALQEAAKLDKERANGKVRGILHGLPIFVKVCFGPGTYGHLLRRLQDNIATHHEDGMSTTAGSIALLGARVPDDAQAVKQLKKAGAIVLGKAALSEWWVRIARRRLLRLEKSSQVECSLPISSSVSLLSSSVAWF